MDNSPNREYSDYTILDMSRTTGSLSLGGDEKRNMITIVIKERYHGLCKGINDDYKTHLFLFNQHHTSFLISVTVGGLCLGGVKKSPTTAIATRINAMFCK